MKNIRTILLALLAAVGLTASLAANQVKLNVAMAKPFLEAGQKQNAFFKIGLTGFEM